MRPYEEGNVHLHWAIEAPDAVRMLEWFVPLSGVADDQDASLRRVVDDAKAAGVTVALFRIPD